ncbi:MAG: STAS domain-containing protein [Pseudomonadales bacterium]|nr:STAS domain-containing protein [Pseudomonadales bacterium]
MECTLRSEKGMDILELSGEIDLHQSPELREKILASLKRKSALLLDLAQVSYIDSSGIASLVEGFQTARDSGLRFALLRVSKPVAQVLSLTRLDNIFPTYSSLEAFQANSKV